VRIKISSDFIGLKARAIFAYSLLVGAYFTSFIQYGKQINSGGNAWLTGEWLINYSGGFVRRGIFGELFLLLAPSGIAGLWTLFLIQCAFYVPLLIYSLTYLHRMQFSWPSIALACSPAAFIFIGLDPAAFARKESIGLTSLILLIIARNLKIRHSKYSLVIRNSGLILFVFAVFASEINFVMLPAVIYLLKQNRNSYRWIAWVNRPILIAIIGATVGLFLSLIFNGNLENVTKICSRIKAQGFNESLCSGGIAALAWDFNDVAERFATLLPGYRIYLPLFLLALLPIINCKWFKVNWIWVIVSFALTMPLFFVGLDWGRWIFIFIMTITILIMSSKNQALEVNCWKSYTALPFVLLWSLPHFGANQWPVSILEKVFVILIKQVINLL